VYEERIPIDYQTALMAEQFNMNVSTVALNGGEDYELLFTIPLSLNEQAEQLEGVKVIGHICESSSGANLVTRDGTEIALKAQGWNSLENGVEENL
jgi:thiamine-monophosphate kinase